MVELVETTPPAPGRRPGGRACRDHSTGAREATGGSSLSRPLDGRAGGDRVVEPVETTRPACGRRPGGRACRDHSTGVREATVVGSSRASRPLTGAREATGWSSLSRPLDGAREATGWSSLSRPLDPACGGDRRGRACRDHSTGRAEATRVVEPVETTDRRAGGDRVVEPVETTHSGPREATGGRACRDHSTAWGGARVVEPVETTRRGVREATGWSSLSRPVSRRVAQDPESPCGQRDSRWSVLVPETVGGRSRVLHDQHPARHRGRTRRA